MVLGQLLAYGGISEGRYATWLPSYGPEMRGGTANCTVVISDQEINAPMVSRADLVAALNQPSIDKFESHVRPGGILVYNNDIITYSPKRNDIFVYPVGANSIAERAWSEKALNVALLGAIVAISDFISDATAVNMIRDKLGKRKPEFLEINLNAYEYGKKEAEAKRPKQ